MAQPEERIENVTKLPELAPKTVHQPITISKKVTDHLANERTFLAWLRTGISVIAFGFVVERFSLLLRELGFKGQLVFSTHSSSIVGVTLTLLGVIIMIVALFSFLHIRRSIDAENFHPPVAYAILLTVITSL